ncbi:MAG: redoxin domain-containing protein [Polyangiales bacterium]
MEPRVEPRFSEAAELLESLVHDEPRWTLQHPEAHYLIGRARFRAGDFARSVTAMGRFVDASRNPVRGAHEMPAVPRDLDEPPPGTAPVTDARREPEGSSPRRVAMDASGAGMVQTHGAPRRPVLVMLALASLALTACGDPERPSSLPVQRLDVFIAPTDAVTGRADTGLDAGGPIAPDVVDASSPMRDVSFDLNTSRSYPNPPYGGAVGQAPPPFTLTDCNGQPFNFSGATFQQSRATVLGIFTGNCATCEADARALQALAAETGTRGVRVVAVLQEGAAPMEQPDATFCASWRMRAMATHPILLDVSRTLDTLNLAPRGFPLILVADGTGIIRGRYVMQPDWAARARDLLATLAP